MLRLVSDADANGDIVRGLRLRLPEIDLVRVQDVLPEGVADPDILVWAAAEGRVLLTNDRKTMIDYAKQRVVAGDPMPGVIATTTGQAVGKAIADVLLIVQCMSEEEMRARVVIHLPFR